MVYYTILRVFKGWWGGVNIRGRGLSLLHLSFCLEVQLPIRLQLGWAGRGPAERKSSLKMVVSLNRRTPI